MVFSKSLFHYGPRSCLLYYCMTLLSFERAPRPIRQLETIVAGLGIWALGTFTNNLFGRYIFMLQHFLVWYHWMKIVWTKFGIRLFIMICLFQILLSYMTCQFVDIEFTWWRLFQKGVLGTKFDIYVFTKIYISVFLQYMASDYRFGIFNCSYTLRCKIFHLECEILKCTI